MRGTLLRLAITSILLICASIVAAAPRFGVHGGASGEITGHHFKNTHDPGFILGCIIEQSLDRRLALTAEFDYTRFEATSNEAAHFLFISAGSQLRVNRVCSLSAGMGLVHAISPYGNEHFSENVLGIRFGLAIQPGRRLHYDVDYRSVELSYEAVGYLSFIVGYYFN
jgi:hypothetical protein